MTVLIVLLAVALMVLTFSMCKVAGRADDDAERMAASMSAQHIQDSDAILLAKVMQIRSGGRWPDWLCMLLGETIMNRVESWRFPNTIEGVIFDTHPVYFTETYTDQWKDLIPEPEYIDLAERLISGERALGNKNMLFTGNAPEGTGVLVSYYDKTAGQIVYFCRG